MAVLSRSFCLTGRAIGGQKVGVDWAEYDWLRRERRAVIGLVKLEGLAQRCGMTLLGLREGCGWGQNVSRMSIQSDCGICERRKRRWEMAKIGIWEGQIPLYGCERAREWQGWGGLGVRLEQVDGDLTSLAPVCEICYGCVLEEGRGDGSKSEMRVWRSGYGQLQDSDKG